MAGQRLLWELAEAGLEAQVEIADPNLEDVFVAVTREDPVTRIDDAAGRTAILGRP